MKIRTPWLQIVMSLVTAGTGLVGAPVGSAVQKRLPFSAVGPSLSEESLALPVAGMIRGLDRGRVAIVGDLAGSARAAALPRYAGAGYTAIHKAILEGERLINEGKDLDGMALLVELSHDLIETKRSQTIEPLMSKWNVRYPSRLPVDIQLADVDAFLASIDALCEHAFIQAIRTSEAELLAIARDQEYDSLTDLLEDEIRSEPVETVFPVEVDGPLKDLVDGLTHVRVTVKGIPRADRIIAALETQYPRLLETRWFLRTEPAIRKRTDTILPGTKLTLVVRPDDDEGILPFGPTHGSVWSLPLFMAAIMADFSPATQLIAALAAVIVTTWGTLTDSAFRGTFIGPGRRLRLLGSS